MKNPKDVDARVGVKKKKPNNFKLAYDAHCGKIKPKDLPTAASRQLYKQFDKRTLEAYLPKEHEIFDPYEAKERPTNLKPKYRYR